MSMGIDIDWNKIVDSAKKSAYEQIAKDPEVQAGAKRAGLDLAIEKTGRFFVDYPWVAPIVAIAAVYGIFSVFSKRR